MVRASYVRRLARSSVRGPTWGIDVALVAALLLARTTGSVVFWFHIVFLVLTVSAMFLGIWAFAVRAGIWVPVATAVVAEAVRDQSTQPEELIEIPLLTAILVVVFVVTLWRARAMRDLERAQAQLMERHRSELSKLEAELEASRKMDTIGRLAGGIAHDFNNVLTAIAAHCEDIVGTLDAPSARSVTRPVHEIEAAVGRASSLVRDLTAFSRRHVLRPTTVDVNDVVASVAAMLQPLMGDDVTQYVRLGAGPCLAHVVRSRLEQVIVNLAVNAREAMPDGGSIELATGVVEFGDAHALATAGRVPAGRYTRLVVRDDGPGVDAEDLDKVFEPFFTTKEERPGAGLGLSIVRDIVAECGGMITLDSGPGCGSSFSVYLPVPAGELADGPPETRAVLTR